MYNDNIWRFLSMKSMINDLFINFEVLVLHHRMYLYEDKSGNDVNETLYTLVSLFTCWSVYYIWGSIQI
jgi:hypothetical protein